MAVARPVRRPRETDAAVRDAAAVSRARAGRLTAWTGPLPGGGGAREPDGREAAPGGVRRRPGPAPGERLPLWFRLRCGLAPRTLAALSVVLVAAVVLAAHHFLTGRPEEVRAPETVRQGASVPAPRPLPPPLPPAERAGARVVIDVSGKVRRPGVLRLPTGSRVADALAAAGGVVRGTDVTGLNRARVLTDGEHVVVGAPPPPPQPPGHGPVVGGVGGAQPTAPLSLATATVEQLDALPGVGPVLARHIVDHRTRHGGFRSVDQLREVRGIGDRRFADLRPLVRP